MYRGVPTPIGPVLSLGSREPTTSTRRMEWACWELGEVIWPSSWSVVAGMVISPTDGVRVNVQLTELLARRVNVEEAIPGGAVTKPAPPVCETMLTSGSVGEPGMTT